MVRLFQVLATIAALAPMAPAQSQEIAGGVSSTAPIELDGTSMSTAPSWPVVNRDVIRTTSAPGLILTSDQNAITLMPETTVRVRIIAPHQTWIFLREGGLSVRAKNDDVLICAANRLFQPSAAAKGDLKLEKSGAVTRVVASGLLKELPVSACGEELVSGMSVVPGAVAGGTASASATTGAGSAAASAASIAAAGGVAAGLATAIGAATSASSCASAGCNFNPVAITPSAP